jgi:hypothetical protein
VLDDVPLSHWEQLVGLFDVRASRRVAAAPAGQC